jgi:argininosuccinate lyase
MTLWGGRFTEDPHEDLMAFTADRSDRRLLQDDLLGSAAHARMLGEVGLLTEDDTRQLVEAIGDLLEEAREGRFRFDDGDEDVHSAVERRLHEVIGPLAGKLHTGRSRNDQVALDLRLYLTRARHRRVAQLRSFGRILADKAEEVGDTVVPSYTHLQQAQAIPLGHHLLAYAWMLVRDIDRFEDAQSRISISPLGAGASGGSSLPLDPQGVADELGMDGTFSNSLDAVSSRDFVAEYAFCCAQALIHLSRLGEELVLWSTAEFGWVTFADRYTTGSSALPQKKNADIAELVRGKTGRVIGDLTGLLTMQKGLPLSYNRDLQEDKAAVFDADDTLAGALAALSGMVATASFDPPPPSSWVTALDLAEVLAERGIPFREAHEAVGRLVARLVAEGKTLGEVTAGELEAAHLSFGPEDLDVLDPQASVERRRTPGGGSHVSVLDQLAELRSILGEE